MDASLSDITGVHSTIINIITKVEKIANNNCDPVCKGVL